MRTGLKIAIAFAATLVLVVPAAQAGGLSGTLSAAKIKQRAQYPGAVEPGGQIACTKVGCQRVPAGCHSEIEYNFDGMPTGFNIIVCTGGRR
jgi:hypothetical protein